MHTPTAPVTENATLAEPAPVAVPVAAVPANTKAPALTATADFEVRERRLKSILTYQGTAHDLNERSKCLSLKTARRPFQQCSDCSQMCAETLTYCIKGAAVVVHSPIGCCSEASPSNVSINVVARSRGIGEHQTVRAVCTNIQERDTIYGASGKLRGAITLAFKRYAPTAIFVQSSCAAGIIGDDIESVTDEMAATLGIPVVPIFCEGFKSRMWSSGFDAVFHGVLRKVVRPPRTTQEDLVNIFNFLGSDSFTPLLAKLGLRANYLLPLADIETIASMSEAACTAHICETLATYVAQGLERSYGVPEVKAPSPFGIAWTDLWLRAVARHTGKSDIVESVIDAEHERIAPRLAVLRHELAGKKVYIFAGDSYAHSLTNMAIDLGLKPVGIATLHHDQKVDGDFEELNTLGTLVADRGDIDNFTVCNKQPYQMIKILRRLDPDLLIVRHQGLTIMGAKLGIPTILEGDVNVSAGYEGVLKIGERLVQVLRTRKLLRTIADRVEWPYTDRWLEKQGDIFVKEAF
ncbi:MAG: hypothetical protein LBG81_04120 [Coriobacteriaceae bacterium]|jgi:nitrogenase molybdenum-iron protein alpha chain|nr:hypothetical protein [Coriobacteriaceae bacterium]